jgi:hypothetical protein
MDKKIFGLIAAVSGLGTLGAAQADTPSAHVDRVMAAQSFSELLEPIPNAAALLIAADERDAAPAPGVQLAQDYHHHHHHSLIKKLLRLPHHHHHHHHYRYHHHHHHHHHQTY